MPCYEFLALCRNPGRVCQYDEQELQTLMGLENYKATLDCEYWFCLLNSVSKEILAECSARKENPFFIWHRTCTYSIWDVFVPIQHRGNNYALLLILNAINYLDENHFRVSQYPHIEFSLVTNCNNVAARKTYDKIFGGPSSYDRGGSMIHYSMIHSKKN